MHHFSVIILIHGIDPAWPVATPRSPILRHGGRAPATIPAATDSPFIRRGPLFFSGDLLYLPVLLPFSFVP
jgi:hypothetical protein